MRRLLLLGLPLLALVAVGLFLRDKRHDALTAGATTAERHTAAPESLAPITVDASEVHTSDGGSRRELDAEVQGSHDPARLVVHVVGSTDGTPMAGIGVLVIQRRSPQVEPSDRLRHRTPADAGGVAEFELEAGVRWVVWIEHAEDHGSVSMVVDALAAGESAEVRVVVPTRNDLAWFGRVQRNGEPVAGAHVDLLEYDEERVARVLASEISDASGIVGFDATSFTAQDVRVQVDGIGRTIVEVVPGHGERERAQELPLWPVGTLRATVVDPGGLLIPGVEVHASATAYLLAPPDVQDANAARVQVAATTDAEGVAVLTDLPAELVCDLELRRDGDVVLGEKSAFLVQAGVALERRYVIGGEGAIAGQLLGIDGRALSDVPIELFPDTYERRRAQLHTRPAGPRATRTATTDDSGQFRFVDVPYGVWFVGAVPPGPNPGEYTLAMPAEITAENPAATIMLRMEPAAQIAGVVLDDEGNGVAGSEVTCWNDEYGGGPRTRTDETGAFRLAPLAAGVFNVHVRTEREFVSIRSTLVATGTDDLVIRLTTGARIRGTVRDAWTGELVEDVQVHAYAYDSDRPNYPFAIAYAHDGTFDLVGLPEGAIALKATTKHGGLGVVSGIRVRYGAGEEGEEVEIRVERAIPIRVRYAGSEAEVEALVTQNDATVNYVGIRAGETITCLVLPGRVSFRIDHPDGSATERDVDVEPGGQTEIVLGE